MPTAPLELGAPPSQAPIEPTPTATNLLFQRMPALDILKIQPFFRYGPTYATCLIQYLQALQWPANDAAREILPTITVAELMLDMYFSTGIAPPQLVRTGTGSKDFVYQLGNKGSCSCTTFSQAVVTFADSITSLSLILDIEIIPGIRITGKRKEFLRSTHGTKEETLAYKMIPRSPKLICQEKVQQWKQNKLFALKSASLIGKSPVGDSPNPWPLHVSLDHPFPDHDFSIYGFLEQLLLTNELNTKTTVTDESLYRN